jgi:hypothetical protein
LVAYKVVSPIVRTPRAFNFSPILALFFSMRNEVFEPALEGAALEENAALALEALKTDISPQPDHLPLIAAAGVLLLEADPVAQL